MPMFKKNTPVKILYNREIGNLSPYGRIYRIGKSGLKSPFDKDYKIRMIDGSKIQIFDPVMINQISEDEFNLVKVLGS